MTPALSVIVPTHQRPELLIRLLNSLKVQSLDQQEFEVIVVATQNDPGISAAQGVQWPFAIRVTSVPDDPSKGRSASIKRNYGASLATGEWLAFVDDDCTTHPDWLSRALSLFKNKNYSGLEGYTHIPEPEKITLTYKGIQRLGRPGGYQTCNMFYRKKEFMEIKGFDPEFPFYLEDTDLAWTLLENSGVIGYSSEVIVEHPVPPPEPQRLMANAIRMIKVPYLYRKHPVTFKNSSMRVFPRPYFIFLMIDILAVICGICLDWKFALLGLTLRLLLTSAYMWRLFRGCSFTAEELRLTFWYTIVCPWVGFVQLMRGNLKHKTFLFLR